MKIVVVGSTNTDLTMKVKRLPQKGETVLGGQFSTAIGGKGANQAVAAARAGGEVTFISRVGDDMFGEQAIEAFRQDGMNVDFMAKDADEPTGTALIYVDENGDNLLAVASGANLNLMPVEIEKVKSIIESADILLMQLEVPVESDIAAAKIAKAAGVKVILNPAPAQQLPSELLENLNMITPNETETELLTGQKVTNIEEAKKGAEKLLDKGIDTVLITLGAKGVLLKTRDTTEIIPGFKVKAVDTTAAGDVFNGSLCVALAEGKSLAESLRFANAAAALSVTKLGAQPSAPKRAAIEKLLEENK